ncbi:hypothetical protein CONCODRAFT_8175 [Conidiobolus coronatus NRRL 28638]|uniref:Uncharacterized protein n=1 Tax=Conidiobolus coronatus (strain ATCC 28846 / CBS 209.66 / NRRL 28638) TaxID=796925 RepID=A0A137P332_CONC2|nr:hypothetical protein CONCODRAFT_8175 [Conidiobolus coronatus NRRL 28638]|eukprot:KXN69437.1 hypothetical protein CONCODRAFT_8175 [Conidiobolus coronatus NRRL 28638]
MDTLRDSAYSNKQKGILMGVIVFLLSLMIILIFYLDGVLRTSAIGIFALVVVGLSLSGIWAWRNERNRTIQSTRDAEVGVVSATVTEADMGLEPLPKYELPPKYELDNSTLPRNQPSQTAQ